jgi:hypothetical protein
MNTRATRLPVLIVTALLASCSSSPKPPASTEAPAAPHELLAPFAKLVGGTWTAAFNAEIRDEQSYSWVFGGRFLRSRHQVRSKTGEVVYEGETIYGVDPTTDQLVWWYWNSTGGHLVGTARWEDGVGQFEGENHGAPGQTQRVRTAVEFTADGWSSTTWYLGTDGSWVPRGQRAYRRPS